MKKSIIIIFILALFESCAIRNTSVEEITLFNDEGMVIPLKLGYRTGIFDNVTKQESRDYVNSPSKQSVSWIYNGRKIILQDKNTSVIAYPSVDFKYVIAIYKGLNSEYKPPSNAVIYKANGKIHKILKIPVLESENILKRISFNKDSNPPFESSIFEGGLLFDNCDWGKNEEGNLIDRVRIIYDRDWIEWRVLNVKTGEIGKYIGQGML